MTQSQDATPDPDQPEEGSADPRGERVAAAVQAWQRHLVDLGGRNTLLWYRDLPSGTLDLTTAHPGGLAMLLAGRPTRLSDLFREPAALAEARRRARVIRAKTTELHEERGIAAGFVAVGMASWRVAGASRPPAAPVLLRSCVLRPRGASQDDFDLDLGPDVELNPVLEHYLRSEQGLEVDGDALADMATVTGAFDAAPVFSALAAGCEEVPGFTIVPRLVLGTFSYAKLPMVADLAAQLDTLADHDVVAALAGDPGALRAVRTSVPQLAVDQDPEREHLVLDADSSQHAVIEAVRSGANLVVKGPPGTGKSQTIANLIAALASDGRRVLFVAEKRAAIDAVVSRLDRLGLGDLVLDAYDGATNRRRLAREVGDTLDRAVEAGEPDTAEVARTLVDRRTRLVGHSRALHEKREPWGVSAWEAQLALAALSSRPHSPTSHVRIHGDALRSLSRDRVAELSRSLTEAASLGAWTPGLEDDPWYAARVTSPEEAAQALEICSRLGSGGLAAVREQLGATLREAGIPEAGTASAWADALDVLEQVRQTLEVFRPEVFDVPLVDLVAATGTSAYRSEHGIKLGWWARRRLRRQARRLLRPGAVPPDLHTRLQLAQRQRVRWQELAGAGARPEVPLGLEEVERTYATLAGDLAWLGDRLAPTSGGGDLLHAPLEELQERLAMLAARPDRLSVVPRVVTVLDELRAAGMGPLVDDLATRGVLVDDVAPEVDFVWWTSLLDDITVRDPAYGAHDGEFLRRIGAEYIEADHAHLDSAVDRVRGAVGRRLREVLADHPDQEALVRAEASKSRRHRPLREMLPRAGDVLTAVKPCWAMSPLVVASVLPPGRWFDVVVFDEASQIPPAQAVSAISRATQVVVAGDERQLPPTSFFTSADDDVSAPETDALTEGFESVLDVLTAALPVRRLTWHYRSLDERLIAFANKQVYHGSLVTFPGTSTDPVVRLELVDGSALAPPGQEAIESTEAEVDRVVQLVLDHARRRPTESLGVIALGLRHAARIEDALRAALADADGVGSFFDESAPERFFVKNLERVQGDERDAIILSIGYGKTPHGRVLHRFGPLNLDGGERRLNVAVTRARRRMTVVAAFGASDLDPNRLKARGALMLRDFLAYAAAGGSPAKVTEALPAAAAEATQPGGGQAGAESVPALPVGARVRSEATGRALDPLVADFAQRLRWEGLVVHERYGSSEHRLDLAIEDPHRRGRVLVAVETDGPAYAAMTSTRDRDRLRIEQLRRLGWEHVRIWSTDLFRDPARDVARVTSAVRAASKATVLGENGLTVPPRPADPAVDEGVAEPGAAAGFDTLSPLLPGFDESLEDGVPTPDPTDETLTDRQDEVDAADGEAVEPDAVASEEVAPVDGQAALLDTGEVTRVGTGDGGDDPADGEARDTGEGEVGQDGAGEGEQEPARPRVSVRRSSLDQTLDDTDTGWGERRDEDAHDRWLQEQRPPHWE
ncbi:AAA domain-containing protein [Oryzihumus sp.]